MWEEFLSELVDIEVGVPLIAALIAGCLIGFEREAQGKAAGLRTHMLVCFAAALMTRLGLRMMDWHADLPVGTQVVSDMARMPHAVLTGIGFLGAGVIFRDGASVQGLTTAATLWLTAALGIVFGSGLIGLGAVSTLITLAVLVILRMFHRFVAPGDEVSLEVTMPISGAPPQAELEALFAAQGLSYHKGSLVQDMTRGERVIHATLRSHGPPVVEEEVLAALSRRVDLRQFKLTHRP